MDLPLSLVVILASLFVVFIGVALAIRASRGAGARPGPKRGHQDGAVVGMGGSDTGGSRKGHADSDSDGGDSGGGDGGGGGD